VLERWFNELRHFSYDGASSIDLFGSLIGPQHSPTGAFRYYRRIFRLCLSVLGVQGVHADDDDRQADEDPNLPRHGCQNPYKEDQADGQRPARA
jgi:hypothetical protein